MIKYQELRKVCLGAMALILISWWAQAAPTISDQEFKDWKSLLAKVGSANFASKSQELLKDFLETYPSGLHAPDARFAIAENLFWKRDYAQAAPYYEVLVKQKNGPYADDALLRLGEIEYNTKHYTNAEEKWSQLARSASSQSPLRAEAWYYLALCQIQRQDYFTATRTLDRLFAKFPFYADLTKSRELSGILRIKEKRFTEAIRLFDGVDTPTAALYRGLGFFDQKQYLEAAGSFDKLEQLSSGAYAEMGAYFKAECFRIARNETLATTAYDKMIAKYPASRLLPYAITQKASFLIKSGHVAQASKLLEDLLSEKNIPENVQAYAIFLKSRIATRQGDMQTALRLVQEARKRAPASKSLVSFQLGLVQVHDLVVMDQWSEAATRMRQLLGENPYYSMGVLASILTGQSAFLRNDWSAAVAASQTALLKYTYSPLSDVALGLMLTTYFQAHKYQELVTDSNRILQVTSSHFSSQNFLWRAYSYFLVAEAYYRMGNYSAASQYYEEASQSPALADRARLYLAWSLYHEKKYGAAVKLAHQMARTAGVPDDYRGSAAFLMAGSYFEQGNYKAALQHFPLFRRDFPKDPHVPETWLLEGWANMELGNSEEAVNDWTKLGLLFPDDPMAQEAMLLVGRFYFQSNQNLKAERILGDFLTRWPNSRWAVEAQWSLAQSYYNREAFAQAIKEYQLFESRFPHDPRTTDAKKQILLTHFRQAMSSQDPVLLAEFVRNYPKSMQAPEAQYQLGHLHFTQKRWRDAITQFHKLLLEYPESIHAPAGLIETAEAEEHCNDLIAAERDYESLLQLFPTSPMAINVAMHLGAVYFNTQKYAEAARSFRFVTNREASAQVKADATYNMAVTLKKNHDHTGALKAWDAFLSAYPQDPRQLDALLEKSSIFELMRKPDKAVKIYQQVAQDERVPSKKRAFLFNRIGDILLAKGNKQKALEAYSQLLSLSPANNEARLSGLAQLAAIYEEKEDWSNAMMVYRQIKQSHGRADWVEAAAKRDGEIQKYLESLHGAKQENDRRVK